jgi:hypothetical protein
MRLRTLAVLFAVSVAGFLVAGCSATTASNPPTAPQIVVPPANQTVTVGHTASFSVTATGTAPLRYQWNKNGAAVSGATSATYTTPATTSADNGTQFNVVVSNAAGSVTSNAATLTVTSASTVTITTTSLPNGTVQVAYSATLQATGGTTPYTWSVASGSLPAALTLSASGGISGTPTTAGTSSFTIQVADSAGNKASAGFTITISSGTGGGTMPSFGHVFIVVGENSAYGQTYSATNMPYLTSLANKYGLATKYWSDTHPSIGNYEGLTAGQIFTNDDGQTPTSMPLSSDNIAFEVQQAGKTWKDYVENLPSMPACGGVNSGSYIVRHDPLEYFTNINTQSANYVCFSQFATDLANHAVPNLSWLSPNGTDDGHDSSTTVFDSWLQTVITPLLASSYFQTGGDGLLIITFDEDDGSGTPNCSATAVGQGCGGQVETVIISTRSKPGYQSTAGDPANLNNTYDEANILRTIADALGVKNSGLGGAATRVPMADFFQ